MMHRFQRKLTHDAVVVAALLTVACKPAEHAGAGDSAAAADTAAAAMAAQQAAADSANPSASSAAASQPSGPAPLVAADVDRWRKGMEGELAAVHDAEAKLKAAKTANDTMTAMMAANETSTRAAGAKAAGVDEERYNVIRATLSPLAGLMAPIENEMNVKEMPPAILAQLKQGREQSLAQASASVPKEVLDALRPRAAELRKQDLALTGARLKASGIGQ